MNPEQIEKLKAFLKRKAEVNASEADKHDDPGSCDRVYEHFLKGKYQGFAVACDFFISLLDNPELIEEANFTYPEFF